MKKSSRPNSRSTSEKLKALSEFDGLAPEKRGEFLRMNGLHEEHLDAWRLQIEEAFTPVKRSVKENLEKAADQKKIKQLEKEIRRKDKALAEVSALLILKKKADLLWGTDEEE